MKKYLSFIINKESVGIEYSDDYTLEQTHINKVFKDEQDNEFMHYKGDKISVIDTSEVLGLEPLKKFDGLLFVHMKKNTIAYKTEGFFKELSNVEHKIDPIQ